jgi:hypothetical protein
MEKTYKIKIDMERMEEFKATCKKSDLDYMEIIENMIDIFLHDTDMMIKANKRWAECFKENK